MKIRKILVLPVILFLSQLTFAQEVNYIDHAVWFQQKPAYTQYSGYTSFDMAAVTTLDEKEVNVNLPYQIKLGNFKQVPASTEFHVVSVLRRLSGKFSTDIDLVANIYLTSLVYDKFGNKVTAIYTDREDVAIKFDKALSKAERGDKDLVRQKIIEKVTELNLKQFIDAINGAKTLIDFELAGLKDVKKTPELADFTKTAKDVKTGATMDEIVKAMESNVPYWEKMLSYSGEGDSIEVKRAAYQNLCVYNIFNGNREKALEDIEKYKAIDKVHKMMMGLLKVKHSENCEKMLTKLYPGIAELDETAPVLSSQQVKDNVKYFAINGTITVDAKKISGTYQGQVLVSKLENPSSGNILSFDAESADVIIITKDDKGETKTINTDLSKITSLKDSNGNEYIIKKFGTVGSGAYYCLLKTTYHSEKVTVYRTQIPAANYEYVVKKAGDDKGVRSTLLNSRKQLVEYLSDCTSLMEKVKNGTVSKKDSVEKIAELYSNCESGGTN